MKNLLITSLIIIGLFQPKTFAQNDNLSIKRVNNLNPKLKLELPKIMAQKDSNEVIIDTVRHD